MHENTLNLRSVGEMGVLVTDTSAPIFRFTPGGTSISGKHLSRRNLLAQRSISVL
jgi:hypothetical protein